MKLKNCHFYADVDKLNGLIRKTGCDNVGDAVRVAVEHYLNCKHAGEEEYDRIVCVNVLGYESEMKRMMEEVGAVSYTDAVIKILEDRGFDVSRCGRCVYNSVKAGAGGRVPKYLKKYINMEVVKNGSE